MQIGLRWDNDNKKIKQYLKKIQLVRKKHAVKFSKVYYLQIFIRDYTFYCHC